MATLTDQQIAEKNALANANNLNNTITPSQLAPATPVKIVNTPVDTTNYGALTTGANDAVFGDLNQLTQQRDALQKQQQDSGSSLYDLIKGTGNKEQDLLAEQDRQGVSKEQEKFNKLYQSQLDLNAQATSLNREAQAIPLQVQENNRNTGATDRGVAPQEAGALRLNALKALSIAQQSDINFATLQGSETRLNSAKDKAKQIIDAQYAQKDAEIKAKEKQYELNKDTLTQLDAKRTEALNYAIQKEKDQTIDLKNIKKETTDKIFDMIKEGKVTPAVGYQAISDIQSGNKSVSEALANIGINGQNQNPGIVGGYNISKYATDPDHEIKVNTIYKKLPDFTNAQTVDSVLKSQYPNTKITGTMIMNASNTFNVDPKMIYAIMAQDSSMGTAGIGARNNNPGNIGQFDELGTTPTGGYKTLQDGVNAVAKWLSKNKATGIYNGEFGSTIEQISQLGNGTDKSKAEAALTLQNAVASKDYKNAYQLGINKISDQLATAEEKAQFNAKQRAIPAAESLKEKLNAFALGGGDTGLLKGTAENIEAKLGKVKDPALRALATELKIAFQTYRKDMSGAAFSNAESADYESVNPTSKKDLNLNLAILDGMISSFKNGVDSTVSSKAPGLLTIRELADFQGLSQPQILVKLANKNESTKAFIESEKAKGTPMDIVIEALGYKNLIQ